MTGKFIEKRVGDLEAEVKTLKLIVEQLRKPSTKVFTPTITINSVEDKPKSPNQLRAEIIEKAKVFVVEYSKGEQRVPWECGTGQWYLQDFEFVVNEAKRTIVVLCKSCYGGVYKRGIAKCMPSDVFNEHIGRAIALGRALGLDVSEFEQAVQPTGLVAGHIIEVKYRDGSNVVTREIVTHDYEVDGTSNTANFIEEEAHWHKIINDTNAIYGGVE